MAREYICLYHSYLDAIQALGDAERGRLFTAMLEYSLTGEAGHLSGNERFVFPIMRSQIDRDKERYDKQCKANAANGKSGGRPAKPKNPKNPLGFSESEKSQDKEEDENKGEDKGEEKGEYKGEYEEEEKDKGEGEEKKAASGKGRAQRFRPPTLEEVQAYVWERHSPVDPQGFLDFYQAKGWMVGKTAMKDWKAACRNAESWERWERRTTSPADLYRGGETL